MITSKKIMKDYILADRVRNIGNMSTLKYHLYKILGYNDYVKAFHYLSALRQYEYGYNCCHGKGIVGEIVYRIHEFNYHRLSNKYNVNIGLNMVGPGFRMRHIVGGGIIINCKSVGSNCSANVNVLVGNKNTSDEVPIIGDNVKLSTGCMVIGKVTIGNNVIVAPNAVVTKDIPDNCVVGGIPAKVIKMIE